VRIIGGQLKGRNLIAPKTLPVRPTTDFAKSALFNILSNYFDFSELRMLDLFCGTGSISFEFASRGCTDITCVDEHALCLKFIRETSAKLGIEKIHCVKFDAFKYLQKFADSYDLIFADPPFIDPATDEIPGIVFQRSLLKPGGWLVVEHQAKRVLQSSVQPSDVRIYGNCAFSIYKNEVATG